jgi:hypothetical protein
MSLTTPALEVHPARSKAGQVSWNPHVSCHPESTYPIECMTLPILSLRHGYSPAIGRRLCSNEPLIADRAKARLYIRKNLDSPFWEPGRDMMCQQDAVLALTGVHIGRR